MTHKAAKSSAVAATYTACCLECAVDKDALGIWPNILLRTAAAPGAVAEGIATDRPKGDRHTVLVVGRVAVRLGQVGGGCQVTCCCAGR
jgi:hypothetical protein